MITYYWNYCQLKVHLTQWIEYSKWAQVQRIKQAAELITRVTRGVLARMNVSKMIHLKHLRQQAIENERIALEKKRNFNSVVLTNFVRLIIAKKRVNILRAKRDAAIIIQKIIRGYLSRCLLMRKRQGYDSAVIIQKKIRQILSKKRVIIVRKIRKAEMLLKEREKERFARLIDYCNNGAALTIARAYRAYKIRRNLKSIIYWNRIRLIKMIQAHIRGYLQRKRYAEMTRAKLKRRELERVSAVCIQKRVRGIRDRKLYRKLVKQKYALKKQRRQEKALLLQDKVIKRIITCPIIPF
jgi:hypothetical protein